MCGKNGLVERNTCVNQMLNDPSYISQGTLCFAYDKLFVKIIVASIEDSIVAVLDHLNEGGEKEQETAVKERFVVERTVQINTAIRIYDQYLKLSGLFTTQIFYIQLCRELWNGRCDYFLVDIKAHVSSFVAFEGVNSKKFNDFLVVERLLYKLLEDSSPAETQTTEKDV